MPRRRLPLLSDAADDVREAVARARARRRPPPTGDERDSATELKRRLDQTRERLRRDIPPRRDDQR